MNNEENRERHRHPDDCEEGVGGNGNDQHGQTVAILEFHIRKLIGWLL